MSNWFDDGYFRTVKLLDLLGHFDIKCVWCDEEDTKHVGPFVQRMENYGY
jgi:hypothetical protein